MTENETGGSVNETHPKISADAHAALIPPLTHSHSTLPDHPNFTGYSKLGKVIYRDRIGGVFPRSPTLSTAATTHGTFATHFVIACVLKKKYTYTV